MCLYNTFTCQIFRDVAFIGEIYIHIYTLHTYICIYACVYVNVFICIYICMCMCTDVYICT